jgi:hypothetical protein
LPSSARSFSSFDPTTPGGKHALPVRRFVARAKIRQRFHHIPEPLESDSRAMNRFRTGRVNPLPVSDRRCERSPDGFQDHLITVGLRPLSQPAFRAFARVAHQPPQFADAGGFDLSARAADQLFLLLAQLLSKRGGRREGFAIGLDQQQLHVRVPQIVKLIQVTFQQLANFFNLRCIIKAPKQFRQ